MGVRGELFSTKVSLQNRTYFFNVKENRLGDLYLNIVESKNRDEGGFERQSVILFAEDLQEFLQGFDESLQVLERAARDKRRGTPERRGSPSRSPTSRSPSGRSSQSRSSPGRSGPGRDRPDRDRPDRDRPSRDRPGEKRPRRDDNARGARTRDDRPKDGRARDDRPKGRGEFAPRKKKVVVRRG